MTPPNKYVVLVGIATVALLAAVVGHSFYKESKCLRREDQTVHYQQWTQFMFVGGIMIPIIHPAYDAVETVCVEYSE